MGKKSKLTINTIEDHLKKKEIKNDYSLDKLEKLFFTTNYYYKVSAFTNNHEKVCGKHNYEISVTMLDFLSKFDSKVRFFFLRVTMDIEHYMKAYLLKLISEYEDIDSYSIVDDFFKERVIKTKKGKLKRKYQDKYSDSFIKKEQEEEKLLQEDYSGRKKDDLSDIEKIDFNAQLQKIEKELQKANWESNKSDYYKSNQYAEYKNKINEIDSENTIEKKRIDAQIKRDKEKHFEQYKKSKFSRDKISNNQNDMSVWFFLDTILFSELIQFTEFFYTKYNKKINNKEAKNIKKIISSVNSVKEFRNMLAHNQVVLINVKKKQEVQLKDIYQPMYQLLSTHLTNSLKNNLTNYRVSEMLTTLYVFFYLTEADDSIEVRLKELKNILKAANSLPKEVTDTELFSNLYIIFNTFYVLTKKY